MSRKHDRATELRAIADGRLLLNVRNGVTVSRSMLAKIADELDAECAAHAETKRERDEAIKAAGDQATLRGEAEGKLAASEMAGIVDGWKRRAEAYRTQRDEALKALEPFAKAGELFADPPPDYAHMELIWRPAAGDAYALYADHLRAARRALGRKA